MQSTRSPANLNYGSTTLSPRSFRLNTSNPPPLDIGEASVSQPSNIPSKSRLQTVAFAGQNGAALSKSPEEMEEDERLEATVERDQAQSGESEGSRLSGSNDPTTPLNRATSNQTTLERQTSRLKSPRMALSSFSRSGPSPKAGTTASPRTGPRSMRMCCPQF
jgi:hypothetical protein